jgi:hypothetical protein
VTTVALAAAAGVLGLFGASASAASATVHSGGDPTSLPAASTGGGIGVLVTGAAGGLAGKATVDGSGKANNVSGDTSHGGEVKDAHDLGPQDTSTTPHSTGGDAGGPHLSRMDPLMLFLFLQSIATNGLLALDFPDIYRAFTVTFAWANFILVISSFKRKAQQMRKCNLDPVGICM